MKPTLLIVFLALLSSNTFGQRVIENPAFEISSSGIRHISKIELNKNETRIHIYDIFLPKWWDRFDKDVFVQCDNGTKINLVGIEGVKLGDKITMPESGEKTIVLLFPPIKEGVKKIDFNNEIFGVSLVEGTKMATKSKEIPESVSKWMDTELKKVIKKPVENFNSPQFFNKKTGRLIGYIKGYDVRLGFKTGIIYTRNDITREDYPVVIEIHPDGRFEGDIPLTNATDTYLVINKEVIKFYIEPEQTVAMILDWNQFLYADRIGSLHNNFKSITFKGPLAKINQDLIEYNSTPFNYNSFSEKMKTISPQTYKEEEAIDYKKNADHLATYLKNNSISDKAKVLLKNKINLEHANRLFNFVMNRDYYAQQDTLNTILKIPVANNYFDFIKDLNLNDQSLLVLNDFSSFVNRLEFSKPILIYPKSTASSFTPEKTFDKYLEDEKIVVTENDKVLIASQKTKTFKSYEAYQEFQKQFSEPYKNGWIAYDKKYIEPFNKLQSEKITMEKWQLRDSIVKNVFHLDKNLVYEVIKIRALDFDIKRSNSVNAHNYWNELQKDITHPFLKEEGKRIVDKQYPVNSFENSLLNDNLNKKVKINATAFSKILQTAIKGKYYLLIFGQLLVDLALAALNK